MGKRQLGQLQPSELVVTILISNIATLPIENSDIPLCLGLVPILTLMCFEVLLSVCTLKNLSLRRLIWGNSKILIENGEINQQELKSLRYSLDDLMEQLRSSGIFDVREVEYAVAETNGQLSVCKKSDRETVTPKISGISVPNTPPPSVLVSDRKIIEQGLFSCGLTLHQLKKIIKSKGYQQEDIFLMTGTPLGDYYIVPVKKEV